MVGQVVVNGAMIRCSFGVAPASLIVLPDKQCLVSNLPVANIMDFKPMINIPTFGMCTTQSNPAVAAATAAALGTPTPAPCVPVTTPWTPGSPQVLIRNFPALNNSSQCMCTWGGVITISMAGQTQTQVP